MNKTTMEGGQITKHDKLVKYIGFRMNGDSRVKEFKDFRKYGKIILS